MVISSDSSEETVQKTNNLDERKNEMIEQGTILHENNEEEYSLLEKELKVTVISTKPLEENRHLTIEERELPSSFSEVKDCDGEKEELVISTPRSKEPKAGSYKDENVSQKLTPYKDREEHHLLDKELSEKADEKLDEIVQNINLDKEDIDEQNPQVPEKRNVQSHEQPKEVGLKLSEPKNDVEIIASSLIKQDTHEEDIVISTVISEESKVDTQKHVEEQKELSTSCSKDQKYNENLTSVISTSLTQVSKIEHETHEHEEIVQNVDLDGEHELLLPLATQQEVIISECSNIYSVDLENQNYSEKLEEQIIDSSKMTMIEPHEQQTNEMEKNNVHKVQEHLVSSPSTEVYRKLDYVDLENENSEKSGENIIESFKIEQHEKQTNEIEIINVHEDHDQLASSALKEHNYIDKEENHWKETETMSVFLEESVQQLEESVQSLTLVKKSICEPQNSIVDPHSFQKSDKEIEEVVEKIDDHEPFVSADELNNRKDDELPSNESNSFEEEKKTIPSTTSGIVEIPEKLEFMKNFDTDSSSNKNEEKGALEKKREYVDLSTHINKFATTEELLGYDQNKKELEVPVKSIPRIENSEKDHMRIKTVDSRMTAESSICEKQNKSVINQKNSSVSELSFSVNKILQPAVINEKTVTELNKNNQLILTDPRNAVNLPGSSLQTAKTTVNDIRVEVQNALDLTNNKERSEDSKKKQRYQESTQKNGQTKKITSSSTSDLKGKLNRKILHADNKRKKEEKKKTNTNITPTKVVVEKIFSMEYPHEMLETSINHRLNVFNGSIIPISSNYVACKTGQYNTPIPLSQLPRTHFPNFTEPIIPDVRNIQNFSSSYPVQTSATKKSGVETTGRKSKRGEPSVDPSEATTSAYRPSVNNIEIVQIDDRIIHETNFQHQNFEYQDPNKIANLACASKKRKCEIAEPSCELSKQQKLDKIENIDNIQLSSNSEEGFKCEKEASISEDTTSKNKRKSLPKKVQNMGDFTDDDSTISELFQKDAKMDKCNLNTEINTFETAGKVKETRKSIECIVSCLKSNSYREIDLKSMNGVNLTQNEDQIKVSELENQHSQAENLHKQELESYKNDIIPVNKDSAETTDSALQNEVVQDDIMNTLASLSESTNQYMNDTNEHETSLLNEETDSEKIDIENCSEDLENSHISNSKLNEVHMEEVQIERSSEANVFLSTDQAIDKIINHIGTTILGKNEESDHLSLCKKEVVSTSTFQEENSRRQEGTLNSSETHTNILPVPEQTFANHISQTQPIVFGDEKINLPNDIDQMVPITSGIETVVGGECEIETSVDTSISQNEQDSSQIQSLPNTTVEATIPQVIKTGDLQCLMANIQQSGSQPMVQNIQSATPNSYSLFPEAPETNIQFVQSNTTGNPQVFQPPLQEKLTSTSCQFEMFLNGQTNQPDGSIFRPSDWNDISDFDFNTMTQANVNNYSTSYINPITSSNLQLLLDNPELLHFELTFNDVGCEVTVDNSSVEEGGVKPNDYVDSPEAIENRLIEDTIPEADPMVGGQKVLSSYSKPYSLLEETRFPESDLSFDEDMIRLLCYDDQTQPDVQQNTLSNEEDNSRSHSASSLDQKQLNETTDEWNLSISALYDPTALTESARLNVEKACKDKSTKLGSPTVEQSSTHEKKNHRNMDVASNYNAEQNGRTTVVEGAEAKTSAINLGDSNTVSQSPPGVKTVASLLCNNVQTQSNLYQISSVNDKDNSSINSGVSMNPKQVIESNNKWDPSISALFDSQTLPEVGRSTNDESSPTHEPENRKDISSNPKDQQSDRKSLDGSVESASKKINPSESHSSSKSSPQTITGRSSPRVQKIPASKYAPPKKLESSEGIQSNKTAKAKVVKHTPSPPIKKELGDAVSTKRRNTRDMPVLLETFDDFSCRRSSSSHPKKIETGGRPSQRNVSVKPSDIKDSVESSEQVTYMNMYDRAKSMKRLAAEDTSYSQFFYDDQSSSKSKKRKAPNRTEPITEDTVPKESYSHRDRHRSPNPKSKPPECRNLSREFGYIEPKKSRLTETSFHETRRSESSVPDSSRVREKPEVRDLNSEFDRLKNSDPPRSFKNDSRTDRILRSAYDGSSSERQHARPPSRSSSSQNRYDGRRSDYRKSENYDSRRRYHSSSKPYSNRSSHEGSSRFTTSPPESCTYAPNLLEYRRESYRWNQQTNEEWSARRSSRSSTSEEKKKTNPHSESKKRDDDSYGLYKTLDEMFPIDKNVYKGIDHIKT
ncbi:hypothetical protein HHI36_020222 [Cryptolaemus montrouzieri]|uniref:Uncharacterized protein n=1 Tax=Cryptolaemus montrouzieri TaxID=559131 RepID=A0ABD2N9Z3_9CUCU